MRRRKRDLPPVTESRKQCYRDLDEAISNWHELNRFFYEDCLADCKNACPELYPNGAEEYPEPPEWLQDLFNDYYGV